MDEQTATRASRAAKAATLELYGMGSPNVRKVVLMLEELEAPYAFRHVRVFEGQQFTPQFRELNPFSKAPVLVDDGYPVFESGAILISLAEKFGRFLAPSGPERYEALKWLFGQTSNVGPMFGQFNHFRVMKLDDTYAFDRYRTITVKLLEILDERLATHRYFAGEAYSIADIATYHWAGYVEDYKLDWADFPHLARWRKEVGERPAAQRELEARKLYAQPGVDTLATASKAALDQFFWRA